MQAAWWAPKLIERRGKGGKRRALVAVTRRLAVLLLALWKSGATYEALKNANQSASSEIAA